MNYTHLTIEERACIYQFKNLGMSLRKIAKAINRNVSSISRELKRNNCGRRYPYYPTSAQEKYKIRRLNCHRKTIINRSVKEYIEEKIELTWSPEQIVNYEGSKQYNLPCFSTIYRWINKGYIIEGTKSKLRRKGKMSGIKETRGKFNVGKTIKKRPKEIYKRKTFGHWEADTVVSGKNDRELKSKYCFVTLAERKSRLYLAKHIPDRKEETVTKAIVELLSQFPKEFVKTITCDRGKEFAGYHKIEKLLNIDMYFTDAYCAWQKGTNENSNGLLREFYPKSMDLSKTNNIELKEKLDLINNRPRRCNNYKTSNEVVNEFLKECCI